MFEEIPEYMIDASLQMNLSLTPKDTFVFDEIEGPAMEAWLDGVNFYNELDLGFTLASFNENKGLRNFVPVTTYDMPGVNLKEMEFVAMVEGTVLPLFGFAHRLDLVQFGFHAMNG